MLKRITITIPVETVDLADKLAAENDRSRSWVLSEAARLGLESLRVYARAPDWSGPNPSVALRLDASRCEQLKSDLELSPTSRVKEAQATLELSGLRESGESRERIILFDSYEDYLDWSDRERISIP